jgi:hypothetical protein
MLLVFLLECLIFILFFYLFILPIATSRCASLLIEGTLPFTDFLDEDKT